MNASEAATFRNLAEQVRITRRENDGKLNLGGGFSDAWDIILRVSEAINKYGYDKATPLTPNQIAHIERGVSEARTIMASNNS